MGLPIFSWWNRYYAFYLKRFAPVDFKEGDGLPYLRDKLFISILLVTVPIGISGYIPGIIASITTAKWVIGVIDTIVMLITLYVFFNRRQTLYAKKMWFSAGFFLLGATLVIYLGVKGPGTFILLCLSVWITLYQSRKAGMVSVLLNAAVLFLLFPDLQIPALKYSGLHNDSIASSVAIGVNFIAFNALLVLSVGTLIDQLNMSLVNEQVLRLKLKRESQDLLMAKHKAEESDQLKSAFLANMSHEIRTPMNSILGFSALLSEPEVSGEEQRKYLDVIQKSGARMLNVINDIMDISKIESGQMAVSRRITHIHEEIVYVYNLARPDADTRHLKLTTVCPLPAESAVVFTDGEKLAAVLHQLVKNAIRYTERGSVEFGYSLEESAVGKEWQFFVKDTGIGISPEHQGHIFDPFVKADIGNRLARPGSGLGLSISRSYVDMLKGLIWFTSEPGKGSTFYFTIPFHVT
jgi:signal transduction histidine kinase